MTNLPNAGDLVRIWPAAGVRVQDGDGNFGRILSEDGGEREWSSYWHRRFLEGSIHLHDPRPAPAPAPKKEK